MTSLRTYRFQTKVKTNSIDEKLIDFLKGKEGNLTEKERILQALQAFWLPLALIDSNSFSEKEIALHALTAILRLKEQIAHLSLVMSLHSPTYSHLFASNLAGEVIAPLGSKKDRRGQVQRGEPVKAYTEIDELEGLDTPYLETTDIAHHELASLENTTLPADISQFDKLFGLK